MKSGDNGGRKKNKTQMQMTKALLQNAYLHVHTNTHAYKTCNGIIYKEPEQKTICIHTYRRLGKRAQENGGGWRQPELKSCCWLAMPTLRDLKRSEVRSARTHMGIPAWKNR